MASHFSFSINPSHQWMAQLKLKKLNNVSFEVSCSPSLPLCNTSHNPHLYNTFLLQFKSMATAMLPEMMSILEDEPVSSMPGT
jgi:hypothetical protein